MEYSFFIDCRLPTLNEYVKKERASKALAWIEKKKYTEVCGFYALKLPVLEGLFDLKVIWNVTDNKTDSDNVFYAIKFILDGVMLSKKMKGDGRKYIRHISHEIYTKEEYLIEVKFIQVEP